MELARILNGIHSGYLPPTVTIHGPRGTGKTATRRLTRESASRHDDIIVEYVTLKECRTIFSAAREIHWTDQVLSGLTIGLAYLSVQCTACHEERQQEDEVTVYAYRYDDLPVWDVARCYCSGCAPLAIEPPTLGMAECLATATLGTRLDPRPNPGRLCLTDVSLVAWSPPTEGAAP